MKVFTIVGIRSSGKTTTVTQLVEEFRKRGKHVGTVKSIFCPTFSIDDAKSNTSRHRKSGAEIICAKAKGETALIIPKAMNNTEILSYYRDMDIVILEGDYLVPLPRLVAAHSEDDAAPRINNLTLALVGRIGNTHKEALGLPVFSPLADISALADLIELQVPNIEPEDIGEELPQVPGVTGTTFCQCGCNKHQKKSIENQRVTAYVDGKELKLTSQQISMLLAIDAQA